MHMHLRPNARSRWILAYRTIGFGWIGLSMLLPALLIAANPSPDAAGRWEGAIEIPGQQLGVIVHLVAGADGASWSGTIDIPLQRAKDLPLSGVEVSADGVRFAIAGVPGNPTFDGTLDPATGALSGQFRQGGGEFPFRLRSADSPAAKATVALSVFADTVKQTLDRFLVPSVGVAVVVGDEVVLADGYGWRDTERKLPATGDTLYAIGSVTKSFTAAAVALAVEEGKAKFDQPVMDLLPEFRLEDPARSSAVTVRDLLAHRTGLPRHDFGWYGDGKGLERADIVERLRYVEANTGLREDWQYQNWMFTTAGFLAGKLLGDVSWEEVVETRLFAPLGMTRSNLRTAVSARDENHALPYEESDGVLTTVPFREFPAMAPAGAINSSAKDMAQWVRLQLGRGAVGGQRVLSETTIAELHQPAMLMPPGNPDPEILAPAYALGWMTDVYRGHRRVSHGGNIDGFSALAVFFPDAQVGFVILANLGGTPVPNVLSRVLADRLLALEPIDWAARIGQRWDAARSGAKTAGGRAQELRRAGNPPPRPLAEYVGDYEHPGYGSISVAEAPVDQAASTGGARRKPRPAVATSLVATFHGLSLQLEPWHFETFRASSNDKAIADLKMFFTFVADASGEVVRLDAPFEIQTGPIPFRKLPPARLSDPAFLRQLAGAYQSADAGGLTIRVEASGNGLRLVVGGQPAVELVPLRGLEFEIKGFEAIRVRFVMDEAAGRPSEFLLLQPDGVYPARRIPG